ncbi:MAG: DUF5320 domain-containing protein [Candidatus Nitrosocaldus sp.]
MDKQEKEERDDIFTLYSLLESRIEMLEEHVSMLKMELALIKKIINSDGNYQHHRFTGRF